MMNVNGTLISLNEARQIIDDMPTIDAIKIIKCKDCKHYDTLGYRGRYGWCWEVESEMFDDCYCGKALILDNNKKGGAE